METSNIQPGAVQVAGGLTLRPVRGEDDVLVVAQAVREQGESCHAPTHVIERGGTIVGYASVNAIPILTGWLHDDRVGQGEGRMVIAQLEDIARRQGLDFVCLPCTADCRFADDMGEMGYRKTGRVTLWIKNLRQPAGLEKG